jgi:hypothetical protein
MTPKIIIEFEEIIQQDIYTQILSHNPKPRKTTRGGTGPFQPHNLAPHIYQRNVKMKVCINYGIVEESNINKKFRPTHYPDLLSHKQSSNNQLL